MNTPRTRDHDDLITQALLDLDAAPPAALTTEQRARADETLAAILNPGTATQPPVTSLTGRRPTRRPRRLGHRLILVAAALALTLAISMSGLIGGGTAYASWTARPTQLPTGQQEELAQECRDYLAAPPDAPQTTGIPTTADVQAADLVLADTRGDWSYIVLSGAKGLEATCLVQQGRTLGVVPRMVSAAATSGFMTNRPEPAADEILGTGLMSMSADEGSVWSTEGYVGSDVAAVTVLTSAGTRVEATLTKGRFAAWWPQRESVGDELDSVTYLVTLTDGTELPPQDYDGIAGATWQE